MGVGTVQPTSLAQLKSEFLALKTELAEVKEQNKRYEKILSELITYFIFHTKNTKAQEEICFIVRREKRYSVIHLSTLLMRISLFHPPLRPIHLQRHQPW